MATFNPKMLALARECRGMSQSKLGEHLGLNQGSVSRIEQGLLSVDEAEIPRYASILGFSPRFLVEPAEIYAPAITMHRSLKSLGKRQLSVIEAKNNIFRIQISQLLKSAELANEDIPTMELRDYGTPELVAMALRQHWNVPRGPIANITALVERAGVIIVMRDFGTDEVSGISYLVPNLPPIIFLNKNMPGDRQRFTIAHEIGHIVMHRLPNPDMEEEAHRFAGEFLMPSAEIKPFLAKVTLQSLAPMKLYWKVALSALVVRAKQLGKLTPHQERYLWIQLGPYRTKEPANLEIPREEPTTLRDLVRFHRQDLNYTEEELKEILFLSSVEEFRSDYNLSEPSRMRIIK